MCTFVKITKLLEKAFEFPGVRLRGATVELSMQLKTVNFCLLNQRSCKSMNWNLSWPFLRPPWQPQLLFAAAL